MSFVNTKQQRLIDDSVTNHVKYYDKITSQYLKLRQDIFQLNTAITKQLAEENVVSDQNKISVFQLRFELDKTIEAYTIHLNELSRNLTVNKNIKPPYRHDANVAFKALQEKEETLTREIKELIEVQKPRLDKMTLLAKNFEVNSKSSSARAMNPYRLKERKPNVEGKDTDVDLKNLIFSYDDIKSLFGDTTISFENDQGESFNIKNYVNQQLVNGKIFEKLDDEKYYYKLHRSQLHDISGKTSIGHYDKLIDNTIEEITSLARQGKETRENWNKNADKLAKIKALLDESDDVEMAI
ncbi:uncharacterized protein RJT20DRAFT_131254 [Scheffersomyces xylosifermentans]|uniref:uncharacterized protein n=1 Tax=Scheffersomyces xylosifermentans TaxID=1304137 RepID=UPI00315C99A8